MWYRKAQRAVLPPPLAPTTQEQAEALLSYEEGKSVARQLGLSSPRDYAMYVKRNGNVPGLPSNPAEHYGYQSGFTWKDFLGYGDSEQPIGNRKDQKNYYTFEEAVEVMRDLAAKYNIRDKKAYESWFKHIYPALGLSKSLHSAPYKKFKDFGWQDWGHYLSRTGKYNQDRSWASKDEFAHIMQTLGIQNLADYKMARSLGVLDHAAEYLPKAPEVAYPGFDDSWFGSSEEIPAQGESDQTDSQAEWYHHPEKQAGSLHGLEEHNPELAQTLLGIVETTIAELKATRQATAEDIALLESQGVAYLNLHQSFASRLESLLSNPKSREAQMAAQSLLYQIKSALAPLETRYDDPNEQLALFNKARNLYPTLKQEEFLHTLNALMQSGSLEQLTHSHRLNPAYERVIIDAVVEAVNEQHGTNHQGGELIEPADYQKLDALLLNADENKLKTLKLKSLMSYGQHWISLADYAMSSPERAQKINEIVSREMRAYLRTNEDITTDINPFANYPYLASSLIESGVLSDDIVLQMSQRHIRPEDWSTDKDTNRFQVNFAGYVNVVNAIAGRLLSHPDPNKYVDFCNRRFSKKVRLNENMTLASMLHVPYSSDRMVATEREAVNLFNQHTSAYHTKGKWASKDMAITMGLIQNPNLPSAHVARFLARIANSPLGNNDYQLNLKPRVFTHALNRPIQNQADQDIHEMAFKSMLSLHGIHNLTPKELDAKIDIKNPAQVKALADRVYGLNIHLSVLRVNSESIKEEILQGRHKALAENPINKLVAGRADRMAGAFGTYITANAEASLPYTTARARANGGASVGYADVHIADILETSALLGVNSYQELTRHMGLFSEDPWVISMRSAPPPATLREALLRIFRLYIAREMVTSRPLPGSAIWGEKRSERNQGQPQQIGRRPLLTARRSNIHWYRK